MVKLSTVAITFSEGGSQMILTIQPTILTIIKYIKTTNKLTNKTKAFPSVISWLRNWLNDLSNKSHNMNNLNSYIVF